MRGCPEAAERHGAGHVARCTARGAHGRPGPARHPSRQVPARRESSTRPTSAKAFRPFRPNELWVADVPRKAGGAPFYIHIFFVWGYVAFVTDVHSRRFLGRQNQLPAIVHRSSPGCPPDGRLATNTSGAGLSGLVHHLRIRRTVQAHPLRAGPIRQRCCRACCRRVDSLAWAPPSHTPPSACESPSSTKLSGPPTPTRTASINHNQPPPPPDKPVCIKPGFESLPCPAIAGDTPRIIYGQGVRHHTHSSWSNPQHLPPGDR